MDRNALAQAVKRLGLTLSADQLSRFEGYEEALYQANEVMNLTRVPREECWVRHFLDSLLISPLIPEESEVLDIGCGPGFPCWPLACAREDLQMTGMDSSGKMLGFLRSQPLNNLIAVQYRAEEWGVQEAFDVVTGRALAPLAVQLEISAAFAHIGGAVVPMRTPAEWDAIDAFPAHKLGLKLEKMTEMPLEGTDVVRLFPTFRKMKSTPKGYPRKWAEIKRLPIS